MRARALGLVLIAVACGGESSRRDVDGEERGGARNGGSSNGGTRSGGSSNGGSSAATGGSNRGGSSLGGAAGVESDTIFLYDENNSTSEVTLSIPSVTTAPGDLDICWTDVVSDLDCNPVEPQAEIDAVGFFRFRDLSEEAIEAVMSRGELSMSDIDGYLTHETDHESTCTSLSSFTNFGTPVDTSQSYRADDRLTFLFLFTRGTAPATGAVSMMFAKPSEAASIRELAAEPGCGMRQVSADISEAVPVRVPFDGPWTVNWQNVTRDGQGDPLFFGNIDRVTLWFFASDAPSELEDQIAHLDEIASERFVAELNGDRSVNLASLTDPETATQFSTFRRPSEGTWLFGLSCSVCVQTTPLVLSVFEPVEML